MYNFTFTTIGGNTRVHIAKGEDIRHLGELDEKMWTVLSCPTTGLEISSDSLRLIDTDKDGHIRLDEVVGAANWLCAVVRNPDILLEEKDEMTLADFNEDNEEAKQMLGIARQVAGDKKTITLAEVQAAVAAIAFALTSCALPINKHLLFLFLRKNNITTLNLIKYFVSRSRVN